MNVINHTCQPTFLEQLIRAVSLGTLIAISGCGPYVVIPVKSRFVNDIWFTGNVNALGKKLIDKKHPYVRILWEPRSNPDETVTPPFGVEIADRRFAPEDFRFENLSKQVDIKDSRIESAKGLGLAIDYNTPASLSYHDSSANTSMWCQYNASRQLLSIELLVRNKGDGINPPNLPQKVIKIVTSKGTVILPANYSTLVETLGKPLEHIPQHYYKPDHIL